MAAGNLRHTKLSPAMKTPPPLWKWTRQLHYHLHPPSADWLCLCDIHGAGRVAVSQDSRVIEGLYWQFILAEAFALIRHRAFIQLGVRLSGPQSPV